MGNKNKLLDYIIPAIENITKPGDCICDLMAGTNSVGYALKERNKIISNDMQYYSFIIGNTLLNNYVIPSREEMFDDIEKNFQKNKCDKYYTFFERNYSDTYFSNTQCIEIDSIRYAIDKVTDSNKKNLYLTLLMSAMCKVQSSTGHFAQFLSKDNKRVASLRALGVKNVFYEKLDEFSNFVTSRYENECFNLEYTDLLNGKFTSSVKCFYLDSPYTTDQYSRFYHILETVCKYDNPRLNFKAKYRDDRKQSNFCYKSKAAFEFEKIISFAYHNKSHMVISYSNKGVVSLEDLKKICEKYYNDVSVYEINYDHSSQGSGKIKVKEILIVLKREGVF